MTFTEIITALKEFEGTEEYKNYVTGLVTGDRVQSFLDTDEGKKFIQPTLDKYHTKGLETWKTNNLTKLIDDEVKKRNPDSDPKDIELANLKAQLDTLQKESKKKELTIKAQALATEKKLPVDLVGYFIGNDEKETEDNLKALEKAFTASVGSAVDAKLKSDSYVPTDDKKEPVDGVTKSFMTLNPDLDIKG